MDIPATGERGGRTRARRDQGELRWLLVTSDAIAIGLAIAVAGVVRLVFGHYLDLNPVDRERVVYASAVAFPLVLGVLRSHGVYDLDRFPGGRGEYSTVVRAVTTAALVGLTASYFTGETLVSRSWLVVMWAACVGLVVVGRVWVRRVVREMRRRGRFRTRLVIVGASDFGVAAARDAIKSGEGYQLIGFLDDAAPIGRVIDGDVAVIGRPSELLQNVDLADEVVIVPGALSYARLELLLQQLVHKRVAVRLAEISVPMLHRPAAMAFMKRSMDIGGAIVGLVILSPFIAMIAIGVKVSSPGPLLYPWRVVGQGGRPFVGYKFRTMVSHADALKPQLLMNNEMRGPVFKMRQDPRVTFVGHFLRRYSLDELPQLWSVLKGDMSLVGPRPPFRHEFAAFTPDQRAKLSVKPGMTCLWQISGRSQIQDFDDWLQLDLEYIQHWSLLLDLKILLKTIPAVITRRGAY